MDGLGSAQTYRNDPTLSVCVQVVVAYGCVHSKRVAVGVGKCVGSCGKSLSRSLCDTP